MIASKDLTEKIYACTQSLETFRAQCYLLLEDIFKDPKTNAQPFLNLILKILTSADEKPIRKFYTVYLLLKATESSPGQDFLVKLCFKEDITSNISNIALYDIEKSSKSNDRGKTLFTKDPKSNEGHLGINYVRICLETISYWGKTFGKSDPNSIFYNFWYLMESSTRKGATVSNYLFVGKDYHGQEDVAYWNFTKGNLQSIPSNFTLTSVVNLEPTLKGRAGSRGNNSSQMHASSLKSLSAERKTGGDTVKNIKTPIAFNLEQSYPDQSNGSLVREVNKIQDMKVLETPQSNYSNGLETPPEREGKKFEIDLDPKKVFEKPVKTEVVSGNNIIKPTNTKLETDLLPMNLMEQVNYPKDNSRNLITKPDQIQKGHLKPIASNYTPQVNLPLKLPHVNNDGDSDDLGEDEPDHFVPRMTHPESPVKAFMSKAASQRGNTSFDTNKFGANDSIPSIKNFEMNDRLASVTKDFAEFKKGLQEQQALNQEERIVRNQNDEDYFGGSIQNKPTRAALNVKAGVSEPGKKSQEIERGPPKTQPHNDKKLEEAYKLLEQYKEREEILTEQNAGLKSENDYLMKEIERYQEELRKRDEKDRLAAKQTKQLQHQVATLSKELQDYKSGKNKNHVPSFKTSDEHVRPSGSNNPIKIGSEEKHGNTANYQNNDLPYFKNGVNLKKESFVDTQNAYRKTVAPK